MAVRDKWACTQGIRGRKLRGLREKVAYRTHARRWQNRWTICSVDLVRVITGMSLVVATRESVATRLGAQAEGLVRGVWWLASCCVPMWVGSEVGVVWL